MIYFTIFIFKILENALATLRIILIANNKKLIGAILTFIISIIWIISVSFIVFDFKDYLKIICFAIGSSIGSYLGNTLEEKLALGSIIISFHVNINDYFYFKERLKIYNIEIIKAKKDYKFEINVRRKDKNRIIKIIKNKNKNIKINIIKIFNC